MRFSAPVGRVNDLLLGKLFLPLRVRAKGRGITMVFQS